MNEDPNADVKLALEEIRWQMQQILSASDTLDQKVELLLIASGLIMALTTTLQVSLASDKTEVYWAILILALVVYIVVVGFAIAVIAPRTFRTAIKPDWQEFNKHLIGKPEREAILSLIRGYENQVEFNNNILRNKSKLLTVSICMLPFVIIALFVLIWVQ